MLSILAKHLASDFIARSFANTLRMTVCGHNDVPGKMGAPVNVGIGLVLIVLAASSRAAEGQAPASPEVAAAMQPYLDSYKLAGVIGIIADKTGKVYHRNLLGYADVEAKKPISEDNVFWIKCREENLAQRRGAAERMAGKMGACAIWLRFSVVCHCSV